MKLAAKKASLGECPYASDEAKKVLGAASEPPVKGVALGPTGGVKLGEETVLYRHEKTFLHQTALAVTVDAGQPMERFEAQCRTVGDYAFVRVGETMRVDLLCIQQGDLDAATFAKRAGQAWEMIQRPLVLRSTDAKALAEAARAAKGSRSLLAAATPEMADELVAVARETGHALAVTAPDVNALCELTTRLKATGFNDLVLEFQTHSPAEQFQTNSIARRGALRDGVKALGYPTLRFVESGELLSQVTVVTTEVNKYGSICVLPHFNPALLSVLMTQRMNIYTDPQKPIQVEPKVYAIGEPTPESPVFVTTNFSLTYFLVSGEIENAGLSAWLAVPECEGMSVLTAWAAGKFSGASIAKFCREAEIEKTVKTRELIIPGYVAQISGELEESLPGWKVVVGPQESGDLESFIKARYR
jgi:acetyl-CoA decarbonylase/synthase complex subunit gamma